MSSRRPRRPTSRPQGGGFGAPAGPASGWLRRAQAPPPAASAPPAPPPPPQPGYGYPQAPGQAPQTPPPAGPPSAPPQQPYGYPQAPGAPQARPADAAGPAGLRLPGPAAARLRLSGPAAPVRLPAAGHHADAAAGSAGGRKVNPQVVIIVSAVVAIALIVGGGVWYANSSGKSDEKDTSAGRPAAPGQGRRQRRRRRRRRRRHGEGARRAPAPRSSSSCPRRRSPRRTSGSVAGLLADRQGVRQVGRRRGHRLRPGHRQEVLDAPAARPDLRRFPRGHQGRRRPRSSPRPPSAPRTNPTTACTEVTAFNVDTGKKLWTKTVGSGGRDRPRSRNVSITGTTVAAGGGHDGGAAFDISHGKILWQPKAGTCEDVGYARRRAAGRGPQVR